MEGDGSWGRAGGWRAAWTVGWRVKEGGHEGFWLLDVLIRWRGAGGWRECVF